MHTADRPGLFLVSGPYGVGKDTLLNDLISQYGDVVYRVTTLTTRPVSPDADPTYETVSAEELERRTAVGSWAVNRQFSGAVRYATNLLEIEDQISRGRVCVHSIFAGQEGAGKIRQVFGERAYAVGVLATSGGLSEQLEVLRQRLLKRTRDDEAALLARLQHQVDPINFVLTNPLVDTPNGPMTVYDEILVNDDLDRSLADTATTFAKIFGLREIR